MSKTQTKWIGILILVVGSFFLLYPSINWYSLDPQERAKLEQLRERPKYLVNLGLDLKGGTHMVMELEVDKLDRTTTLNDAMNQAITIIATASTSSAWPSRSCAKARAGSSSSLGATDSAGPRAVGKTALLEFRMVDDPRRAARPSIKCSGRQSVHRRAGLDVGRQTRPQGLTS